MSIVRINTLFISYKIKKPISHKNQMCKLSIFYTRLVQNKILNNYYKFHKKINFKN